MTKIEWYSQSFVSAFSMCCSDPHKSVCHQSQDLLGNIFHLMYDKGGRLTFIFLSSACLNWVTLINPQVHRVKWLLVWLLSPLIALQSWYKKKGMGAKEIIVIGFVFNIKLRLGLLYSKELIFEHLNFVNNFSDIIQ